MRCAPCVWVGPTPPATASHGLVPCAEEPRVLWGLQAPSLPFPNLPAGDAGPGVHLGQAWPWDKQGQRRSGVEGQLTVLGEFGHRGHGVGPTARGWVHPSEPGGIRHPNTEAGPQGGLGACAKPPMPQDPWGCHRSHGDATELRPHFWCLLFGVMGQPALPLRSQGAALCGDLGQTPIWKGRFCCGPSCRCTFRSGLNEEASGPLTSCCVIKLHLLAFGQETHLHGSKIRVPKGVPRGPSPRASASPSAPCR